MDREVTVYTTPTCGYCRAVKGFLKEHSVSYNEVDVSADQEAALDIVRRTDQYSVPVIDIDGTLVIGFDRPRLMRLLEVA